MCFVIIVVYIISIVFICFVKFNIYIKYFKCIIMYIFNKLLIDDEVN